MVDGKPTHSSRAIRGRSPGSQGTLCSSSGANRRASGTSVTLRSGKNCVVKKGRRRRRPRPSQTVTTPEKPRNQSAIENPTAGEHLNSTFRFHFLSLLTFLFIHFLSDWGGMSGSAPGPAEEGAPIRWRGVFTASNKIGPRSRSAPFMHAVSLLAGHYIGVAPCRACNSRRQAFFT